MNDDIAQRLYELRREHGYSQESLAEALNISRQAISKWERAESAPDMGNLIALADLYGISIDELVRAPGEKDDASQKSASPAAEPEKPADPPREPASHGPERPPQAPPDPPADSTAKKAKRSTLKIVLVTILCVVLLGILTSGFFIASCAYFGFTSAWDDRETWTPEATDASGDFAIPASDISSISIDWLAGNAVVRAVPDADVDGCIQVTETSGNRLPLRWRTTGSALEIDYGIIGHRGGCHALHNDAKNLTVLVPQSLATRMTSFSLNAASGEYELEGISSAFLSINEASGRIRISDFSVQRAVMRLASGDLEYSGDIAESLDFDQASGLATIALSTRNPTFSTLSMASGHMSLALPASDFQLNLSKVSGNFSSDYELISNGDTYYGNVEALSGSEQVSCIAMDMVSGNFEIKRSH